MISLAAFFWLMIGFFALIGALRGWTREVVATSGLILSLFAINQFSAEIVSFFVSDEGTLNVEARERLFYALAGIHLTIAFFSYQGPALAGRVIGERLRVRDSIQDKTMGAIVGALNGYLIIGTLWAFLEYRISQAGDWELLPVTEPYPFVDILERAITDGAEVAFAIIQYLPLPLLAPYLPFLTVLVFLFVLVVMI